MILETEVAALAAERGTPEHIEGLKAVVQGGRDVLHADKKAYTKADLDFHMGVANCSENKLLPRLLMDIRGVLAEWIAKSQELPGLRENAQEQHERILKRIAEHDVAGAREEMRAHLRTFEQAYTLLGRISDGNALRTQAPGGTETGAGARP
jgi:GntR family uxuAB operon transcriptional repressor